MGFNQQKYTNSYDKNKYKSYHFRVRKDNSILIDKLDSIENKNKYIMDLIEKDIGVLTIKQIKDIVKPIFAKWKIYEIYIFGSYARGEATINSDIDFYVEGGCIKSYFEVAELKEMLELTLNKKVDLIFMGSKFMNQDFEKELYNDQIKIWLMIIEKDLRLIKTILRYCEKIVDVIKNEKFKKEEHKYDLISFYICQIGETVKNISDNFISSNKEIEWNKI